MSTDLIGTTEACRLLGIDRSTLSRWVAAREPRITPALQLPGPNGAMLFNRADVEALLSYLRLNTPKRFERVGHGQYRLRG